MVKLTTDMMLRKSSGHKRRNKEESLVQFLTRVTHLYLEDKEIDETGDEFFKCLNLSVLYLYDNKLQSVPNLIKNENITHLYLHNNNITQINNLESLKSLDKLFIGYNKISILEGIEFCSCLKELHVENQKLDDGDFLIFDPRSISAISSTLEILNISGNRIESLEPLKECIKLKELLAHQNNISQLVETTEVISQSFKMLVKLDLSVNPITSQPKYRDKIIMSCNSLEVLDGKEISDVSRRFLMNWQNSKESIQLKSQRKNCISNDTINKAEGFVDMGTFETEYNSPSYTLPAFPASNKRKANKLRPNVIRDNHSANQDTISSFSSFTINGSSSSSNN